MPVNFIHICDLHLSHPDLDDRGLHSDTVANLRLLVERLGRITPPPAFIVASGDLTNRGDRASYQLVRDILEPLNIPVVHALGNHDNRAGFRAVFGDAADNILSGDTPYYHRTEHGGLPVITLDSSDPGRVGGQICDEQINFLARALQEAPGRPTLLNIHHPPRISDTSLPWESLTRTDTDRLAETLQGHNIAGLLCGHIHFDRVSNWHGIPVITCKGLHATVDVLRPSGMQIEQGTGFSHCVLHPCGITVSFVPLTPERSVLGEISEDVLRSFL